MFDARYINEATPLLVILITPCLMLVSAVITLFDSRVGCHIQPPVIVIIDLPIPSCLLVIPIAPYLMLIVAVITLFEWELVVMSNHL